LLYTFDKLNKKIMFSLRFPIALKNNLITSPPKIITKPTPSSHYHYFKNSQSHLFPSQPTIVAKCDTMADVANNIPKVALGDEVEGGTSLDEDLMMPAELRKELMPKHVAVIMDGNRRWAEMRGLPLSEGHKAGMQSLKRMVKMCLNWDIKVLTIFMFSTDNWTRSKVLNL
jgi:ditrans,polycis-polyprenyl diphosphate synthase